MSSEEARQLGIDLDVEEVYQAALRRDLELAEADEELQLDRPPLFLDRDRREALRKNLALSQLMENLR